MSDWTQIPPDLGSCIIPGSCWMDGRFWVIGGTGANLSVSTNIVRSWAPGEGSWSIGTPIPFAWVGGILVPHNNKLYLIGGMSTPSGGSQSNLINVWEYNPSSPTLGTWTQKAPLPVPRSYPAKIDHAVNGEIWFIGGLDATPIERLDAYNPTTDTWRSFTSGLTIFTYGSHAALLSDGRVHVVGGIAQTGFHAGHYSFLPSNPPGNAQSHGSGYPQAQMYLGANMVIDDRWYVGMGYGGVFWYSWGFTEAEPLGQENWTAESNLQTDNIPDGSGRSPTYNSGTGQIRYAPASATDGNVGYIAGGMTSLSGNPDPNMVQYGSSGPFEPTEPTIISVSPDPITFGQTLTITGVLFDRVAAVIVDGIGREFTFVNSTTITVNLPLMSVGPKTVYVEYL